MKRKTYGKDQAQTGSHSYAKIKEWTMQISKKIFVKMTKKILTAAPNYVMVFMVKMTMKGGKHQCTVHWPRIGSMWQWICSF